MAPRPSEEFKRDAVRIALTSGLTTARQSIRSIDERGADRHRLIPCLAGARKTGLAQSARQPTPT